MRLGDIIQSEPLLRGLKKRYPNAEIHLLVYSNFAHTTEIISHFDKLHIIDIKRICDIVNLEKRVLPVIFTYLRDFFHKLKDERFDLIVNITPSNIGSLTAALCQGKQVYGSYINQKGLRVINNPWARYFHIVSKVRNCNNINVVDLFMKEGRLNDSFKSLKLKVDESHKKEIQKLLGEKAHYRVALHLGASKKNRSWPPENFAEVARILKRELDIQFILLGIPQEKVLAERFLKYFSLDCLNLVGKTDLKALAAILSQVNLLICNDTGPMHVACGVGTKVISIFLATANPHETGPYGEGHLVIEPEIPCHPCDYEVECKHHYCHRVITPDVVAKLAKHILIGESLSTDFKGIRVFYSGFSNDGMLELFPLKPLDWSIDRFVMLLWRAFFPAYLEEKSINIEDMLDKIEQYFGKEVTRKKYLEIKRQIDILDELIFFAKNGEYYSKKIIEHLEMGNFLFVSNWLNLLNETDDYIRAWGHRNPAWKGLTEFFFLEKLSEEEGDIKEMAEKNKQCYLRLMEQTRGFMELIKNCLKEVYHDCYSEWKGNVCFSCLGKS